jgi:dihydropteroate synthase
MGVVNATPDSFSDGGRHASLEAAVAHARRLVAEGADIIDIGGESTRPGADPVPIEEELRRVVPVVRALATENVCLSIDTRRAAVMRAALAAGAKVVNDVTALSGDPESLGVVAGSGASVVLMHMLGDPPTMQRAPRYDDVVGEVAVFLAQRVAACRAAGVTDDRICIDPGIGFGKTVAHNLALLRDLPSLRLPGIALLVGASRKSFIARLSRDEDVSQRLPGSLAVALHAADAQVDILRVHDVAETRQALEIWRALRPSI